MSARLTNSRFSWHREKLSRGILAVSPVFIKGEKALEKLINVQTQCFYFRQSV